MFNVTGACRSPNRSEACRYLYNHRTASVTIKVRTIGQVWRYPVKGMAGELLESCAPHDQSYSCDGEIPRLALRVIHSKKDSVTRATTTSKMLRGVKLGK